MLSQTSCAQQEIQDFDSINEYINHLNNNVPLDKDKFDRLDEKELLARSSIGASITLKGINEKLDTVVTPEFMATVASQELETKEIVSTIKAYKENDLKLEDYPDFKGATVVQEESLQIR